MNDIDIAGPRADFQPAQWQGKVPDVRIWIQGADGARALAITDYLLTKRVIQLNAPITTELAEQVIELMRILEAEDPRSPIELHITSDGGSVQAGLAIVSAMRRTSCPVNAVVDDHAYSMAATIFIMADHRTMAEHAELLVHDPMVGWTGGSALSVQQTSGRLMQTRDLLAQMIADRASLAKESVLKMTETDTFLTREQALNLHFCDE